MWSKLLPKEARVELKNSRLSDDEKVAIKATQDKVGFTPYYETQEYWWDEKFAAEDAFEETAATTLEGVLLQIQYLKSKHDDEQYKDYSSLFNSIEAGIRNLVAIHPEKN